jgi:cytochrome c
MALGAGLNGFRADFSRHESMICRAQSTEKEQHMSKKESKEVVNWVQKARDFYKSAGKEIAFAEYTNPRGQFNQKQLYVFALDLNGVMLAHGINERFIGKNFLNLKDSDGKAFIKEIVDGAKSKGSGWVDYKWYHPVTKQDLPKTVYFEKVDDIIICSGVYKEVTDPSELELL